MNSNTDIQCSVIKESAWKKYWRPVAAYVYLVIVFFDFLVMPVVFEYNDHFDAGDVIEQVIKLKEPTVQIQALNTFTTKRVWSPLTVLGGGMFHLAFGAILGIAAWTRGQEKVEQARQNRVFE